MKGKNWTERDHVTFCIKIKVAGNENMLAEFKALAKDNKLTSEIIKNMRNRKGVQGELAL